MFEFHFQGERLHIKDSANLSVTDPLYSYSVRIKI